MMKRLNKVKATALAVALSISAVTSVSLAQSGSAPEGAGERRSRGWRGHGKHGGGFGGERAFSQLGLSDAQQTQITQIRETNREALLPLMEQVRTKRHEVRELSNGATFDEALVRQKLTEIADLETKLMAQQFRIHQEMLAVLTPEQKTKLEQTREQFKNRKAERHGRKAQESNQ
jgi:protein CpxP